MMTMITDRTAQDVEAGTAKGRYNATDLNRVGEAVAEITDILRASGYIVSTDPKIDWTIDDIPSPAQMQQYVDDIATLRGVIAIYETTPPPPTSMEHLDYATANNIEKILVDIGDALRRMALSASYTNEIYCGEG